MEAQIDSLQSQLEAATDTAGEAGEMAQHIRELGQALADNIEQVAQLDAQLAAGAETGVAAQGDLAAQRETLLSEQASLNEQYSAAIDA